MTSYQSEPGAGGSATVLDSEAGAATEWWRRGLVNGNARDEPSRGQE